jgi:hypothetical protein
MNVSVPERGFVALIRKGGREKRYLLRGGLVSVPERGFVALIRDRGRVARGLAAEDRVSVPERGFVALIRCQFAGDVHSCPVHRFSPRAGIRGFDTTDPCCVPTPVPSGVPFQSPSGDSWL